ncbi:Ubiquitin-conjugating enzyme family protein [Histomonas meleagridis]|uniref:Ubiquitin-conjugating enzyme family protein n=1 Tax=Histomonas meleagridis TaxID=135588 RepID=UPI0035597892|nr:Ubiquitin-conjugating enzyme family protein [Histomonas meleagridis]KAH0801091.1 Ubiquitin-conjugating enzyme family protein [Histomonas meleagridis]
MSDDFGEEEQFPENYEEDFDQECVIDEGDDDVEFELPDDIDISQVVASAPEPKVKTKEEEIRETLMERFNPKGSAAIRLIEDYNMILRSDPKVNGFTAEPIQNNLFVWTVHLFGFEKKTPIYDDIQKYKKKTGRDYIEFEVSFPPNYPEVPPFVRVVRPRFLFHKGRVTVGGSICNDLLTMESWKPVYEIESMLINLFSEILSSDPRIDFSNTSPYSLEEAKAAYVRVANDHRWKTSGWLPKH